MIAQTNSDAVRHFHVLPSIIVSRLAIILVAMIVVPILLAFSGEHFDGGFFLFYGGLMALVVVVALWAVGRSSLTTSPQGVELRGLGFTVSSTWDNIERLDRRILYGEGMAEGFVLREPGLRVGGLVGPGRALDWRTRMVARAYEQFIPIEPILGRHWRASGFAGEVARYAPRLLES